MAFTMKCLPILSILLVPLSLPSYATVVQSVDIEEMLSKSELVFEGRVIGKTVEAGAGKRAIYTWFTFEILDIIQGSYTDKTIRLKFLGGSIGNQSLAVGNMNTPTFGEKGIYFVEQLDQNQVHPLYGWDQGHFIINTDKNTQLEQVNTRDLRLVYEINVKIKSKQSPQALSSGIASGVQTQAQQTDAVPLTPDQFKRQLRQLMSQGEG